MTSLVSWSPIIYSCPVLIYLEHPSLSFLCFRVLHWLPLHSGSSPEFAALSKRLPGGSDGKESASNGRPGFDPWVGKIPWSGEWLSTSIFLPGGFHGQRILVCYSPWAHKELDTAERPTLTLTCTSSLISHPLSTLLIACQVHWPPLISQISWTRSRLGNSAQGAPSIQESQITSILLLAWQVPPFCWISFQFSSIQ